MSESELDEILKEVRRRSNAENAANPASRPVIHDTVKRTENKQQAAKPPVKKKSAPVQRSESKPISKPVPKAEPPKEDFDILSIVEEYNEPSRDRKKQKKKSGEKSKKGIIIAITAVIIVAVAAACAVFFLGDKDNGSAEKKPEGVSKSAVVEDNAVVGDINPLTGEAQYNSAAVGKRPVAVVVENEYSTEAVRPQWGLSDADIVLEGESEFSTRLLLFWADYTNVPEQVGPTRSARPPFIRFSQLFDSVFIHAGLSKSKGNYVGADEVFVNENVDHVNLLSMSEDSGYFGRDNSRYTAVEHTGFFKGENLPKLLEERKISTDVNESKFTRLNFNQKATAIGQITADDCEFNWSGNCPKTARFNYDSDIHKYLTTDFDSSYGEANLKFENLIFLFDETEYVVKEDYKGSGQSETYCDYKLSGGSGTILSEGTAVEINWGVTDSKLWMKTLDGEDVLLNPGKSYIGYASSNHGGKLQLNASQNSDSDINTETQYN